MCTAAREPADATRIDAASDSYWRASRRPITILAFLLPLVAFYELAMVTVLQPQQANLAHHGLIVFFDLLGVEAAGWYLPGIALIIVLLVWQGLARAPWRVRAGTLGLMALESLVLTIPLLILAQLLTRLEPAAPPAWALAPAADPVAQLSLVGKIAFSIGAGVYEELVFRMLALAALHALLVDVVKATEWWGTSIAIVVSSFLFTVYHWIGVEPHAIPFWVNSFYFLAGVYFGLLFVVRGFGIVVAVHALYDAATAIFLLD